MKGPEDWRFPQGSAVLKIDVNISLFSGGNHLAAGSIKVCRIGAWLSNEETA